MELLLRICVFPIASLEFYKKDYFSELAKQATYRDYNKIYSNSESGDSLESALFHFLNSRYQLHTLDEIDLLAMKYYGQTKVKGKQNSEIYTEMLSSMAKSFICHRNGRLALKYWESESDESFLGPYKGINKIALWNSLNRMISTDTIVIQYLLDNNMANVEYLDGYYSSIMLEDLQLEQILQKGVAETHIHRGAAINFLVSWTTLMNLKDTSEYQKNYQEELLENPIIEQLNIGHTVNVIAIVRLLMVDFLQKQIQGGSENFYTYLKDFDVWKSDATTQSTVEIKEDTREENEESYATKQEEQKLHKKLAAWLYEIEQGHVIRKENVERFEITSVWEYFKSRILPSMYFSEKHAKDDIVDDIFPEAIQTSGENKFLFYALNYIHKEGKDDFYFNQFFWQYIRIKNIVYEAKVQSNTIKGLDYFQKGYKRSKQLKGYSEKKYWDIIFRSQIQNPHLRKLELRCTISDEVALEKMKNDIKVTMRSFFKAYLALLGTYDEEEKVPLIGLVFHFIKLKDAQGIDKCWKNTYDMVDSMDRNRELYYRELQEIYVKQVQALNSIRESIPNIDKYMLGIDAASIENNTEPWVFARAYDIARDSKTSKLSVNHKKIQSLGFTFHVGEDFRHILTGLRHIDEVVEHFKYHAGDRIGHGIALGVDIDYWIQNNPVVLLPRGEYLDNLLWIWGICKENGNLSNLDISYLEQQIMDLAEEIYHTIDGITVYLLWKVYQNKFEVFEPNSKFASVNQETETRDAHCVCCKYLSESECNTGERWSYETLKYATHCRCFLERMVTPIQVEILESDAKLYKYLQKRMINKISTIGIVVETNPTSNLAIGEMQDLFHHYIFHLNEIEDTKEHNSVIVSINSDDPSVFNTNVSNEIAYIFYSLQKRGYSREQSLAWINKVRQYGMDSSFIKDRQMSRSMLMKEIEEILEHEQLQ